MGGVPPQPGQPPAAVSAMQRHEVESLLNSQRELLLSVQQIKTFVAEVQQKTGTLVAGQQQQQGGSTGLTPDQAQMLAQMRDSLSTLHNTVSSPQKGDCATSCLSSSYFFLFSAVQLAILIGYMMYRSSKEAAAKKFY